MGNIRSKTQNSIKLVLTYLGIANKEYRVIFFGLDSSGKTTLLYKIKLGKIVRTIPTIGFNVESITHGKLNLTIWDVGLRDRARPLIRHYLPNTHALIYLIDSNDRDRLDEAKEEMYSLAQHDDLRDAILLVLANKQDLPNAMTVEEISQKLDIDRINYLKCKNLLGIEAINGNGCKEALDWLEQALTYNEAKKPWIETIEDIKRMYRSSLSYVGLAKNKFWSILGYDESKFDMNINERMV